MTIAGDIVRYDARDWIVVDVCEGVAVLRRDDDPDLLDPLAVLADVPTVLDHLSGAWGEANGWREDSPGIWSQT